MKEYLEQQLKKKAHELVMSVFKIAARARGNKGEVLSLRQNVAKIPVSIFEGQERQFDEDKIRYFTNARNSIFEARYYLDLLYTGKGITYYSYHQCSSKLDLLDKLLVSRIRSIDKRKAKEQYQINVRTKYI